MNDVLFARWQMGVSLGFHIVFAAIGIAMPALMVAAEVMWRRTGDAEWLALAKRWAKGTAVFFAVGAVSGTVLSFELGLLFPGFMEHAGPIVGIPFSLEGFAFFTEAIFLGLYLYGWERLSPRVHVATGVVVALSGLLSAVFVTFVNAWMNAPRGFRVEDGKLVDIDPLGALASPYALHEIPHTALAAYMSTSLAVGAIHAWGLLQRPASTLHRKALGLALCMTVPCALLQPVIGHFAGQQVAKHQPLKFAAMERLHETQARAPIELGPIEVPGALSWLATGDPDAVIVGLEDFPREDWPSPVVQHAFRLMVGLGSIAALYALWAMWRRVRRRDLGDGRRWLWVTVALGPTGTIAMEAGWIVTEVGRQPWVVQGVLRTNDSATPLGTMWLPFVIFAFVYAGLAAVVAAVLWKQVRETTDPPEAP